MRHAVKRGAFGAVLLLACSLAAACSFLLDTSEEQCTPDSGCAGKFAGMQCVNRVCVASESGTDTGPPVDAGPWGCLGNVTFDAAPPGNVNVVVPLIDLTSQKGVLASDVFARICAKIDVQCNSPLPNGDAGVIVSPDAQGLLHLTIPAGFDGFVLIDPIVPDGGAPSDGGDAGPPNVFVPSLVFFNPPVEHDLVYSTIVMVKTSELVQIATIEQTPIDPQLGAVFMQTVDCNSNAAEGVSVVIDSQTSSTQGFYFKGGLPALNSPSTDKTGYAGFVNAPLGTRTVTGTLASTTQKIGSATVFTKASMISYTTLAPAP